MVAVILEAKRIIDGILGVDSNIIFLGGEIFFHDWNENHDKCIRIMQDDLQQQICEGKHCQKVSEPFTFLGCDYMSSMVKKGRSKQHQYL